MTPNDADGNGGVRQVASQVSDVASEKAGGMMELAEHEARQMGQEISSELQRLLGEARGQANQRVEAETAALAQNLRRMADQGQALVDGRPEDAGDIGRYLQQTVGQARRFAERLESGGPQALLSDVQGFARRRPGLFLGLAAVGGVLAGRLVRSGALSQGGSSSASDGNESPTGVPYGLHAAPVEGIAGTAVPAGSGFAPEAGEPIAADAGTAGVQRVARY